MTAEHITSLICTLCACRFPLHDSLLTCPTCGDSGILDVEYDMDRIGREMTVDALSKRNSDHWRYKELLPVSAEYAPPLAVGGTPIYPAPALAQIVGLETLLLKDDGQNPTASFKDRASSVGVAVARAQNQQTIACSSTGNAASSLAGMAASVGMRSVIFVPQRAPEPKLAQLAIFGATVLRVQSTYEDCFQLSMDACRHYGWYNRNCAINPHLVEGKKTAGLEIGESLGRTMPDWVAVSVGDGCTIAGIWKGLREMHQLGFADRLPRLLGVQAEQAAPIAHAFGTDTPLEPCEANTLADSIAVGLPRNGHKALKALREAHGAVATVTDEEILLALKRTASLAGVFVEPAAAATVAGIERARNEGTIAQGESVLAVLTGNGLKDTRSALESARMTASGSSPILDVSPDLDAVQTLLGDPS